MKNTNTCSLRTITLVILMLSYFSMTSQSNKWFADFIRKNDPNNEIEVAVIKNTGNNSEHPLIDFIVSKDEEFIKWMYFVNKKHHNTNNMNSNEDFSPITYTVTREGVTSIETIDNCVVLETEQEWDFLGIRKAIGKIRSLDALEKQNLRGDLPEGAMTWISANKKRLKCGVNVPSTNAHVTIQIKSPKGEVIATLVDDELSKGWSNYKWNRVMRKKSTYELHVTVDGQTMIQDFRI